MLAFAVAASAWSVESGASNPFDSGQAFQPAGQLDKLILAGLKKKGLEPADICSDAVFIRRATVDLTGALPTEGEVRAFLKSEAPDKRAKLVDDLMARETFADYWALKWCDALRVKAEFPINLWPNGVQAYYRWVREAVKHNMPYDQFARALLTSSGSNFRVAPVNFYRAIQGTEPRAMAAAAALTFMGTRFEQWPEARQTGMEAFFSRLAFKGTAEWKECIVYPNPAPAGPLDAAFPDGKKVTIPEGDDPRIAFADWLIDAKNPWFARAVMNRQWAWLMGRGIVHEPDDMRPDNPPTQPEALDYLAKELADSGWDLRHTMRLIVLSNTYQQSSVPKKPGAESEAMFACYPVRRLDAEVLTDALNGLYGGEEEYMSMIPEPFTWVPEEHRSIELADGSITSQYLEMFGRPSRDTGLWSERNNEPTSEQRLHLLNSTRVQQKIEKSRDLNRMMARFRGKPDRLIETIYLRTLSRPPTTDETTRAQRYMQESKLGPKRATQDLAWALTNSKEFLYRH